MKTKHLITMAVFGLSTAFAQAQQTDSTASKPEETKVMQKDEPFSIVEQMPEYPGGEAAMHKFIGNNLRYPIDAMQNKISGVVITRFIVSKTGEIKDATVLRGVSKSLDNEALRVINQMPKWKPGMQKGEPVSVFFTMPIRFVFAGITKINESAGDIIRSATQSNPPLIMIDGKESTIETLRNIHPDYIKSISILRDNAAKAAYGEKGKNSVIVITLKSPSSIDSLKSINKSPDKNFWIR